MGSTLQIKGTSDSALLSNRSSRAALMRKDSSTAAGLVAISKSNRHRRTDPRTDPHADSPCVMKEVAYCVMPYNSKDSEQENSLLLIDKGPVTESGAIEVQMMKYAGDYQTFKELKPVATGMHLASGPNNNGMWTFMVDAQGNLVGANSGFTKSGFVEVHRLNFGTSEPWQEFDLSVVTPLNTRSLFEEWDFMLDQKSDLVVVKKGPLTVSSRTEVYILKAEDDFASFKRTGPMGIHMTASMNHYGDWTFLMDGLDNLIGIRRPNADDPKALVTRWTKASNFMEPEVDPERTVGKFGGESYLAQVELPQEDGDRADVHWDFALDSNDDLLCIKEGPYTKNDLTEIHRLSHESNYKNFTLHQYASAAPCRKPYFTDSDGSR